MISQLRKQKLKSSLILKDITEEQKTKIINFLCSKYISIAGKIYIIQENGEGIIQFTSRESLFAKNVSRSVFKKYGIKLIQKIDGKTKYLFDFSGFLELVQNSNIMEEIVYDTSFENDFNAILDWVEKKVIIKSNHPPFKDFEEKDFGLSEDEEIKIARDYLEHFPQLHDLMDFMVAMRLSNDRKKSFVHLQAPSNWGKSFFISILKDLGFGIELGYHNFQNKTTNSVDAEMVRKASVIAIDEFKSFGQELKNVTQEMEITAKFKMRQVVPVYTKLLLSAEDIPSFTGSIDEQITNRVSQIKIDNKATPLNKRKLFKRYGSEIYYSIAKKMIAGMLQGFFKIYLLKVSPLEKSRLVSNKIREFTEKYKLSPISTAFGESKYLAIESIWNVVNHKDMEEQRQSAVPMPIPSEYQSFYEDIHLYSNERLGKGEPLVFITRPLKTVENILKSTTSESEYKKLKFKVNAVIEYLYSRSLIKKGETRKINNKTARGLILPYSFFLAFLNTQEKSEEVS